MRAAVIREQRERHGRRIVAVLPVHYPKPLLTAMNVLAVELWGPPGPPRGVDAGRVQPYVCAIVRNAFAFLASGAASEVDAVLTPHTCDSLQGFATLVSDFSAWPKPLLHFQHPKGEDRQSLRTFLGRELRHLADGLAAVTGRELEPAALSKALALHRRIDDARRFLLTRRRGFAGSDRELYTLLRRGEYLWPADHFRELEAALRTLQAQPTERGIPIMVSGYVCEPMGLFDVLNEAGAFVVADDYAGVGRRIPVETLAPAPDPWDALLAWVLSMPPCPTRAATQTARLEHLWRLYEESGARALLIHTQKFCDPELFDVPAIRQRFAARDVPTLHLEGELELAPSGQASTRLEAFVEMVQARQWGSA